MNYANYQTKCSTITRILRNKIGKTRHFFDDCYSGKHESKLIGGNVKYMIINRISEN